MNVRTIRGTGKHRGKTPGELKQEIDNLQKFADDLICARQKAITAATATVAALQIVEGERDQARAQLAKVEAERDELAAMNRRLTADLTALRAQMIDRDTSDPRDQVTEPIPHLGGEFPGDYLNNRRAAWSRPIPITPLWQSPLNAVTDPGRITDEDTIQIPVTLPAAG